MFVMFQYFLQVLGNTAGTRYRSGRTVLHDVRPLSSGTQTYDTKHIEWPLTQPLKKLEADIQVIIFGSTNTIQSSIQSAIF